MGFNLLILQICIKNIKTVFSCFFVVVEYHRVCVESSIFFTDADSVSVVDSNWFDDKIAGGMYFVGYWYWVAASSFDSVVVVVFDLMRYEDSVWTWLVVAGVVAVASCVVVLLLLVGYVDDANDHWLELNVVETCEGEIFVGWQSVFVLMFHVKTVV